MVFKLQYSSYGEVALFPDFVVRQLMGSMDIKMRRFMVK